MITWWPTTWGKLLPGDLVQAPNGEPWILECAIGHGSGAEYLLRSRAGTSAWSPHGVDDSVSAARPPGEPAPSNAEVMALHSLRLAGLDPRPGTRRWIISGGTC